jgi:predicted nicotinamide N-methyase
MTSRQLALLSRIHTHYQTITAPIKLGDLELIFTRIAKPDQVLDDLAELEDRRQKSLEPKTGEPARMPYWAELWESSLALGQMVAQSVATNQSVLDLGCGMGLAGAAAAATGAKVMLADIEPLALLLARLNTLPWRSHVRVRRVNWQTDRLGEKFDLILGADILYERGQWEYLESFWREHLAADGSILLGEPGRMTADPFAEWLGDRGWKVETNREALPAKVVRIFRLTKK